MRYKYENIEKDYKSKNRKLERKVTPRTHQITRQRNEFGWFLGRHVTATVQNESIFFSAPETYIV